MPAPRNGQEVSALLPLHDLSAGRADDEESELDHFAEEDYANGFDAINLRQSSRSDKIWTLLLHYLPPLKFLLRRFQSSHPKAAASNSRPWKRRAFILGSIALSIWIIIVFLFFPSYTKPPQHYIDLDNRVLASSDPGRANVNNEKVFIAASIYDSDGSLLSGHWGNSLTGLIDLLGPDNVYLSIYENDASEVAVKALEDFRTRISCENTLLNEHLDIKDLQRVVMPDGTRLLKRIAFLAKVRNRALAPLDTLKKHFDKVLYINDVVFEPSDAANLLFSTHLGPDGKADYRAACATDFINPFKFYDTFATRDLEGYDMGVPFYPWFTNAGKGESRKDVQAQKDAIRVRSCWGGMVAFDASYFQSSQSSLRSIRGESDSTLHTRTGRTTPVRFRAEEDAFWDSSECCLIHADIQHMQPGDLATDTKIYMNPYVRVAYDSRTLEWLSFTRRFERLYSPMQSIVNFIGRRPSRNPRRTEQPGTKVNDRVWVSDPGKNTGSYRDVEREAKPGGFCGMRRLLALPEDGHGSHWWSQQPPPDRGL